MAAVLAMVAGGCEMTPAERVAVYRETLTKAEPILAQAEQRTRDLQTSLDTALAYVADTNAPAQDRKVVWQTMQKIRDALPDAIAYEQRVRTLVEQTRQQIDAIEAAGPVDASGETRIVGNAAGGVLAMLPPPWNALAPFAVPGAAIVGWLLEWLRRRKLAKETQALTTAATAIVAGVEKSPDEAASVVKANIGEQMQKAGVYNDLNAIVDDLKPLGA
jgi:Flp pilus assembly protein TadB